MGSDMQWRESRLENKDTIVFLSLSVGYEDLLYCEPCIHRYFYKSSWFLS